MNNVEILKAFFEDNLTFKQIGEKFNLPKTSIGNRVNRIYESFLKEKFPLYKNEKLWDLYYHRNIYEARKKVKNNVIRLLNDINNYDRKELISEIKRLRKFEVMVTDLRYELDRELKIKQQLKEQLNQKQNEVFDKINTILVNEHKLLRIENSILKDKISTLS
jgi:predicted DNA-binding protein YlxM (UPF0122 family)